jgi:hypothetical protein
MADLTNLHVFDYWWFESNPHPVVLEWISLCSYKFIAIDQNNNLTKFSWTGREFNKYIVTRKYYERNL